MLEALEPIYKRLEEIAAWTENWNGYTAVRHDREAVAKAREWITALYVFVAHETWVEPTFVTPDASDGRIVFEWFYQERKTTVYVNLEDIDALQIWGEEVNCKITDHEATTVEDCIALWTWLLNEDTPEDIYPDLVTLNDCQLADVLLAARG